MASSDPPFDAADEPTTQPLRQSEPAPSPDASETAAAGADGAEAAATPSRDDAALDEAARVLRQNTNWFEPEFEAEDRPTTTVTQPIELTEGAPAAANPVEPTPMGTVAARIAAALQASALPPPKREPTAFDGARAYIAQAPAGATAAIPTPDPVYAPTPYVAAQPGRTRVGDLVVRAGKLAAIVFCAWFCVVLALIALYRFINPPFSSLMAAQWLGGTEIHQEWVPLESISPNLIHAVVVSEDGRFCEHWGIDFVEIAEALRRTPHGPARGASTITMQVAKNLFLWPAKSYVRKVIEVPLTYAIELFWPKRRILEVYLNIAEWGPGIFGAEAAAQAHFNRPASRLSAREAAQLAVALPNPIIRHAGAPGPRTAQRASLIQRRTGREPEAIGCVLGGE